MMNVAVAYAVKGWGFVLQQDVFFASGVFDFVKKDRERGSPKLRFHGEQLGYHPYEMCFL
jgi:hypothetical protein